MTTPQPAALPELPKPTKAGHLIASCPVYQDIEVKRIQREALEAGRAYALAALQPKPAEVSDAEIIAIKKATRAADPTRPWGDTLAFARAILALRPAQQATPEPVTRSRECTEPMCACMGGPCAECPEGEREKEIADLRASRDFYKRRADSLQQAQSRMRDPERTMVCDILANGALLVPAGGRYAATPEPVGEPFGWWFTEDPEVFSMPGSGFRRFPNKPQHTVECVPLYTHPAPAPQQVPMPEPVQRLCRYAGQTMRTARNPNITAREAIEIGDYLAAIGITAQGAKGEQT